MISRRFCGGRRARFSHRRGVTVVEFAMTLPLLIILVIGLIEFVRLSNMRHAAENAEPFRRGERGGNLFFGGSPR